MNCPAVRLRPFAAVGAALALALPQLPAADSIAERLEELAAQNLRLEQQVAAQREMIEALQAQVAALATREPPAPAPPTEPAAAEPSGSGFLGSEQPGILISGEAGIAFFDSEAAGAYPNSEFRVDDARLFFEAEVARDVYVLAGVELITRESADDDVHLGEFYVDFENVSRWWGEDRTATLRAGRFNIPFGEEYLVRGVFANPLISHSLADHWGIDEGIELFGRVGRIDYVAAIQNGGHPRLRDFNADKSVTLRLGTELSRWGRVSASLMRTGEIDAGEDRLSELWFGNGFFRALGPAASTTSFEARLAQLDASVRWGTGRSSVSWGRARFDDNDSTADNRRRFRYYSIEAVQQLTTRLQAAARYSRIDVPGGYRLVGQGDFGEILFGNELTDEIERLSLGLSYRLGEPLVLKFEYSFERGRLVNGQPRGDADLFSTELGMKF